MGGNPGFLRVNVETLEQFMKLGGVSLGAAAGHDSEAFKRAGGE